MLKFRCRLREHHSIVVSRFIPASSIVDMCQFRDLQTEGHGIHANINGLKSPFVRACICQKFSKSSLFDLVPKGLCKVRRFENVSPRERFIIRREFHPTCHLSEAGSDVPEKKHGDGTTDGNSNEAKCGSKVKRKKLKGKRAVVRWLKFFRYRKKKEYQRMTAEEKILYKLRKARKKEERLVEALKKIEPVDGSITKHDPEILTPEEHFFFLKMGIKCKNYVPVGRRGIYKGVILNMHLHWKKHQTLKVIVKTFTPDEVKQIAVELARLSGGIVLDIPDDDTIIMYRGKNYAQPPTEIMSPRITLSRKRALDQSKYREALRAVRMHIPRLEQELELLHAKAERKTNENHIESEAREPQSTEMGVVPDSRFLSKDVLERDESDDESMLPVVGSDSDSLSDIFEMDSDSEPDSEERPLFLHQFEKFSEARDVHDADFEEQLRRISAESKREDEILGDDLDSKLDEVDRIFLEATRLLRRRR